MQDEADGTLSNDLLSPICNVRGEACHSLDQSCTCTKWFQNMVMIRHECAIGRRNLFTTEITCIRCVICKFVLLNELSLLLCFCTGKKLIHFTICWNSRLHRVWYSAVGLICISTPRTGTRGRNAVWIPYQTARCALPGGPIRKSKENSIVLFKCLKFQDLNQ